MNTPREVRVALPGAAGSPPPEGPHWSDIRHWMRPGTLQLQGLPPLALYIHLPWCLKKCPYCDFNSHEWSATSAPGQALPEQAYLDALRADLEAALPLIWGRSVHSVFIGGGTPSLFSPEAIDRLLGDVRALLRLDADAEITLEANPGTFEKDRFRAFREAGVTRLSIGVQSFNDVHLKALGRVHDRDQAMAAVEEAAQAFDTFNLDIMYALPFTIFVILLITDILGFTKVFENGSPVGNQSISAPASKAWRAQNGKRARSAGTIRSAFCSRAREVINPAFIQCHVSGGLYQGRQQRHTPLGSILQRHQGAERRIVAIGADQQILGQQGRQLGACRRCLAADFGQSRIDLQYGAAGLLMLLGHQLQIRELRQIVMRLLQ